MPSQKTTRHSDKVELEAWRQSTFVVVALAALVFVVQRVWGILLGDVVFEICIFYVPAVAITLLYLYFRTKLTTKSQI